MWCVKNQAVSGPPAGTRTWVSPSHCSHKKLLPSAEAGPQSALSHWLVASVAPRGPPNSGESLTFQVSLSEDSHLTNPAGKGQDPGPRAQWPGLKPGSPLASGEPG